MLLPITAKLRSLLADVGIPKEWLKEVERRREQAPGDQAEKLIQERVHDLKTKAKDVPVKRPGLFLRDLNHILSYVEHDIKDPTKMGLKTILVMLSNDVAKGARKEPGYVLPRDQQLDILDAAAKLKDSAKLIQMIANLFDEVYEGVRKAAISRLIRKMAVAIG